MAKLLKKSYPTREFKLGEWEDEMKYEDELLIRLGKEGKLLQFGVADGSANYYVVSVSPPVIQHISLNDAYQIPDAHIRGLRTVDIKELLEWNRKVNELFDEREGKNL